MNKQKKIIIFIITIIFYFLLIWPRSSETNSPTQQYSNDKNVKTKDESTEDKKNSDSQTPTTKLDDDSIEEIVVDLRGAVTNPGIYKLDSDARMYELIKKAGGFKAANQECINQAQILTDEQLIIIPSSNEECSDNSASPNNRTDKTKLNINEATVEQLTTLPGIGQTRAQQIIDYRDSNGKFKSIDDLKNVNGIGEQTFLNLSELISV